MVRGAAPTALQMPFPTACPSALVPTGGPVQLALSHQQRERNLRRADLDSVKSTAERVSAYSQQASDVAAALEKTRKKNK